jgi:hypothetical protein
LLDGLRVRLVKNKLKKEDELHIYDTYRTYLQTQEKLTLEIKIMESKVGIISHKPCKTKSHLRETYYVFTRFKTLKPISYVAVEGGIVSKIFKIQ